MIFKQRKNNLIFWIIFGVGFTCIFTLAIVFDLAISKFIVAKEINHSTSVLNEIFAIYGSYIVAVPIYVGLLALIKLAFSKQTDLARGLKITIIIFYNLVFLGASVYLTIDRVWFYKAVTDFLTELIAAITMYLVTIITIILTSLTLFTSKIIKQPLDEVRLLEKTLFCLTFVILSLATIGLCKIVFGRPRPLQVFNEGYDFKYTFQINFSTKRGTSFPSGHTMGSISCFGLMFYLKKDTKKQKIYFLTLQIIIGVLATITGLSRLLYLRHFLSDVLFATLICSLYVIFTKSIVRKIFYQVKTNKRLKEVENG
ncbi:hypothetical protein SCLARK_001639 [Spiroplasma clarkii]|uniref:Phosphatase PAP2 family protein n=1 Tax=Spiroplasma clarkii TaxID=2139 RepID=A0A1Y0L292_9MOLU|nr:phosphatase PAP2 family protein [Spiroplasma clarkii]ARU92107.1 hypothetical protein SCLARK_001639 [Spiroplasma clarkii]ATX71448.1 phosphatase PAP2 family protein [Spiroplasma clarkii]